MNDTCTECDTPLMNTPSGQFSVCPNGHGKLHPPVMLKPFDTKAIPRVIAVCPECDGNVEVECNEWTMVDGVSRPTQGGLLIYCDRDNPLGDPENDKGDDHHYAQCDWVPVHLAVYKWVEAVE